MIPRLSLKYKNLDKFDYLDKTITNKKNTCNKLKIIQSYSSVPVQQNNKFNQLVGVLFVEWLSGQRLYNELHFQSRGQKYLNLNITLRNSKLDVMTDILLNSLFLSDNYKFFYNNSSHSFVLKNTGAIKNFLFSYNSNLSKIIFYNDNQSLFILQTNNHCFHFTKPFKI